MACLRSSTARLAAVQPGVAGGVLARVVRVEIDEAPLDLPVADLEYVTPAPGRRLGNAGPPRAVLVLSVAGPLADEHVSAGEDPVEVGVVVGDRLQGPAHVREELADLLLAAGQAPLREVHLGGVGKQGENAPAGRGPPAVVECLEILHGHRLALLIGHGLAG